MYKVMLQASPEYRMNPEDLYKFYANNKDGNMVPYSNFMTMERIFGPNQITRYNMSVSFTHLDVYKRQPIPKLAPSVSVIKL